MSLDRNTQNWGTRIGVILAVTGSAVGLGNFLRFPGLAAEYSGGAFMIPYFIALLLLGLPMAWVEWGLGRYGGRHGYNSTPGIYRAIWKSKVAPFFGVFGMIVPVVIYMYYVLIEAWCLGYSLKILFGAVDFGNDSKKYGEFFSWMTGADADGNLLMSGGLVPILLLFCLALNFTLIYRGLNKGIEWFCTYAMPALILCAVIVLAYVLTLGTPDPNHPERNVISGLGYMWNPSTPDKGFWEALANPKMWLEAAGQIFFSLSVGFGIVINYASYVKRNDDISLSALTSASGNEFVEVAVAGMLVIPAAFMFLGAGFRTDSGFALGFVVLPQVFSLMPLGTFIGFLFFFLLFLAAMTSSLSMLQPAIALMEEGLGLGRKASVAVLGFITFIGTGFVFYFSKNLTALDTLDFWAGTFFIYIVATFQVILFGWVLGRQKGIEEVNQGADLKVPALVGFVIKYVSPAYLIIVFMFWAYQQITTSKDNRFLAIAQNPIVLLSVVFLLGVIGLFTFLIMASVKRWEKIDKQLPPYCGKCGANLSTSHVTICPECGADRRENGVDASTGGLPVEGQR